MELIKQPKGSAICGHCSVAMVAGHDVNQVISRMGFLNNNENDGSTCQMYYSYFRRQGIAFSTVEWPDNRKKALLDISGKGIMSVTDGNRRWGHAVAFNNGVIYDPAGYVFENLDDMKKFYKRYKPRGIKVFNIITVL